jgi:ribosomal protein S18 acetylase RimI-like enzyme
MNADVFRHEPRPEDLGAVRALVLATAVFKPEEVTVAVELVQERLARGPESGYEFIFRSRQDGPDHPHVLAGYACYGRIPCTRASWDLYWIAVDPAWQGHGLGRRLLREVMAAVRAAGGERIFAETSSTPAYGGTRRFYLATGFVERARFEHFYDRGDDKVVYELRVEKHCSMNQP